MVAMSNALAFADVSRHPRRGRRPPARLRRRRLGWRAPLVAHRPPARPRPVSDDLRLFASTFAAGFLFVAVLIG